MAVWNTAIRSAAACLDGPIVANVGLPSLATDRRGIQWHPVRVATMTHKTYTARPTEPAGHSGQGRRIHLDGTRNGWQPPKHGLGGRTSQAMRQGKMRITPVIRGPPCWRPDILLCPGTARRTVVRGVGASKMRITEVMRRSGQFPRSPAVPWDS